MTRAQFQLYLLTPPPLTEPGPTPEFHWRLITGNHRDIGRGPGVFSSAALALESVNRLANNTHRLESRISLRAAEDQWRWELTLDRQPAARSSRAYARRIEAEISLRQFLELAVVATASPVPRTFGVKRRGGQLPTSSPVAVSGPVQSEAIRDRLRVSVRGDEQGPDTVVRASSTSLQRSGTRIAGPMTRARTTPAPLWSFPRRQVRASPWPAAPSALREPDPSMGE